MALNPIPIKKISFAAKIKAGALIAVIVSTMGLAYKADDVRHLIQGNVLNSITHAPVDGFVYPIEKVPNWKQVGYNSNSKHYDEFTANQLISIPPYNPTNVDDVNTNITFTTLYLGKYAYAVGETPKEESGSHGGVDIVAPEGTPVKSIANGVVEFAGVKNGYGNTIVIRHDNVPSFEDANKKVTYRSGYSHMSQIEPGIQAGTVVKMGQKIAEVGDQGYATTYHLHFTLDKADALFFPYWPFTSAEASAQGYDMYTGVNSTIGLANGQKYTVNPLKYVDKYKNSFVGGSNTTPPESESSIKNEVAGSQEASVTPEVNTPEAPTNLQPAAPGIDSSLFAFELSGEVSKLANGGGSALIISDTLNSMASLNDSTELKITVSGVGKVSPTQLKRSDFINGKATVYFSSEAGGISDILVGKSVHSVTYFNRDEVGTISKLDLEFEGDSIYKNSTNTLYVKALDLEGRLTPLTSLQGTISFEVSKGSATFIPSTLSSQDFSGGIAKVEVSTGNESELELKLRSGAIVSDRKTFSLRDQKRFTDVPEAHPYAKEIYAMREAGVLKGYSDNTFKPDQEVSRVEMSKILALAAGLPIKEGKVNFKDTDEDQWYYQYVVTLFENGVIEGYPDNTFGVTKETNNAEFAKMLLNSFDVEAPEQVSVKPYEDVQPTDWFARYVYLVNKMNLKEVQNNKYQPAESITRAQVAYMAYRLKEVKENKWVSYVEGE